MGLVALGLALPSVCDDRADNALITKCQDLGARGTVADVPALEALLGDARENVAHAARWGLEQMPFADARAALNRAATALKPPARIGVLQSLGNVGDAASVKILVAALDDADADVRAAAVFALGKLATPEARAALKARIGACAAARAAYFKAAGRTADNAVRAGMCRDLLACGDGLEPALRQGAQFCLLKALPEKDAAAAWRAAARSPDGARVCGALAYVSAAPKSAALTAAFAALLQDPKAPAEKICAGLSVRGDVAAVPALLALANRAEAPDGVRRAAVFALVHLHAEAGLAPLAARIRKGDDAAGQMLVGFTGPAAEQTLRALAVDADARVRERAFDLIRRRHFTGGVPAALKGLGDADRAVSRAAFRVLKEMGTRADVPAILAALHAAPGNAKGVDALVAIAGRDPLAKYAVLEASETAAPPAKADLAEALARIRRAETVAERNDGFRWLFDGSEASVTTNWHGNEGWWEVRNGLLTAESTPVRTCRRSSFLVSDLACTDFDVRAEILLSEDGNTGLGFRTLDDCTQATGVQGDFTGPGARWKARHVGVILQKATKARNEWILSDRGEKTVVGPDKRKTVTRFADAAELLKAYRPCKWNDYRIVGRGPHVQVYLNGQLMSELFDEWPGYVRQGHFALQMHPGPPMKVAFRNIRVKVLDR